MPSPTSLNIQKFAAQIRAQRGKRGLRDTAEEIREKFGDVSASTLSRIEQEKVPDLETFFILCAWLGTSPDEFNNQLPAPEGSTRPASEVIEAHLRADRTLPKETIEALSQMIRFAYDAAIKGKIPVHKNEL